MQRDVQMNLTVSSRAGPWCVIEVPTLTRPMALSRFDRADRVVYRQSIGTYGGTGEPIDSTGDARNPCPVRVLWYAPRDSNPEPAD